MKLKHQVLYRLKMTVCPEIKGKRIAWKDFWSCVITHVYSFQARKLLDYLSLQIRSSFLFVKFIFGAYILPAMSVSLSLWNESSDFIVAFNALKDGEWFLGTLIGVTPFFMPVLTLILLSHSSTYRHHIRKMEVSRAFWFPFLQILGHLQNRYHLLQPRKEMYKIEKQLLTCSTSEEKRNLLQQKAVVQSQMIWPFRRLLAYKYLEAFESILESVLQYFLLFKKTKEVKNIVPYLKSDYLKNGLSGSIACSLFSSEFSFMFFTLNKFMTDVCLNGTFHLLPSLNVGFGTIFELSLIAVVLQLTRMAIFIVSMNGFSFILVYYLLHRIINHFWFPKSKTLHIK